MFDILTLCTVKSELYMIEKKKTIISCRKKRAKGGKEKKEFRSNILWSLWDQEVLLLLE